MPRYSEAYEGVEGRVLAPAKKHVSVNIRKTTHRLFVLEAALRGMTQSDFLAVLIEKHARRLRVEGYPRQRMQV